MDVRREGALDEPSSEAREDRQYGNQAYQDWRCDGAGRWRSKHQQEDCRQAHPADGDECRGRRRARPPSRCARENQRPRLSASPERLIEVPPAPCNLAQNALGLRLTGIGSCLWARRGFSYIYRLADGEPPARDQAARGRRWRADYRRVATAKDRLAGRAGGRDPDPRHARGGGDHPAGAGCAFG